MKDSKNWQDISKDEREKKKRKGLDNKNQNSWETGGPGWGHGDLTEGNSRKVFPRSGRRLT